MMSVLLLERADAAVFAHGRKSIPCDAQKGTKAMAKDKELNAVKDDKDKKEKKSKKSGGIVKWFKDLKIEMKKVVWPTKKAILDNSIVVFAAMFLCAAFTFLLDRGFLWLLELAISG